MTHTTNKAIKDAYNRYLNSELYTVYGCYVRPSYAKCKAFDKCLDIYRINNGRQPRIISHNTTQFTFGFIGFVGDKQAFFYITKDNSRYIYLDELGV